MSIEVQQADALKEYGSKDKPAWFLAGGTSKREGWFARMMTAVRVVFIELGHSCDWECSWFFKRMDGRRADRMLRPWYVISPFYAPPRVREQRRGVFSAVVFQGT